MARNKLLMIGTGNIGRELLGKLSRDFDITCIERNPDAASEALKIRDDVEVKIGDATSRLFLEEVDVNNFDIILVTTTTEKVNLEVVRVLHDHFEAKRIVTVGITQKGIEILESTGAEVENIFTASAIGIRNKLEQTTKAAHGIGIGKNEILEVEVHPNSRLANKRIGVLAPIRWKIGIIYRNENIIIPRPDVVLKPHDRIIILGDPNVLKTVSEILSFSFEQFPLEYGSVAVAYLTGSEEERFFDELDYLMSAFPLTRLVLIYSKRAVERAGFYEQFFRKDNLKNVEVEKSSLPPLGALQKVVHNLNNEQGMIIMAKEQISEPFSLFSLHSGRKMFLENLIETALCPILLAMGTLPYEKVAVPAVKGITIQHVTEASLEIASSLHNEVSALLVRPSQYIASDEDLDAYSGIEKAIRDTSLMYKSSVNTVVMKGNPVHEILKILPEYNLLVADAGGWKKHKWYSTILSPDIIWHIIKGSRISTLLLPPVEETL